MASDTPRRGPGRPPALFAVAVLWLCAAATPAQAQTTSGSIAEERSSIYSSGDLILVNPQQSTAIFLTVIVLSTAFEYALEFLMAIKNRYQRTIVLAVKEEAMTLSAAHMLLLWGSFSFPLALRWHTQLQFVAMCLLYMVITYLATVTGVVVLLARIMSAWRTFEWSAIAADAQHDKDQQLFKMSRQVMLTMLPFDVPGADPDLAADDEARGENPNAVLVYSSLLTVIERRHLKTLTDFTPLTWIGLALLITVNGFRAVTVDSVGGLDESGKRIAQALAFIAMGYLMLGGLLLFQHLLYRRLNQVMFARAAQNGGAISKKRRTATQREADREKHRKVLFFSSVPSTLQIFKVFWLGIIWYVALLIVGIFRVLWRDFEWFALMIYVAAIVPPIGCVYLLPWAQVYAVMAASVGAEFDPELVRGILAGDIDVNDHDVADVDDDDGAGWAGIADSAVAEGATHAEIVDRALDEEQQQRAEAEPAMPDEWDGPTISLHEAAAPEQVQGSPPRVVGVRPVLNDVGARFDTRPKRAVFDDAAVLRRERDKAFL
eukprot:CAMPEP_0174837888 /NCGR_PEP_ID=MMETSP1114-20130205/7053_1 /TAXON_ID=312471 /ORGANISM="Neobodo designis, Strain CCAP 1951/1" /LENGTH=546 /DNA_ID=CAMNT_0016071975 /DNA_START=44 /DNA_END=1684 /DNA_ORIENTATION=-